MKRYRLTESKLRNMIREAVKDALNENVSEVVRAYRSLETMAKNFFVVLSENGYVENNEIVDEQIASAYNHLDIAINELRDAFRHPEGSHGEMVGEPLRF